MYANTIRAVLLGLAVLAGATLPAAPAAAQATVPMKLTVGVAGRNETLRGTGECAHEPRAYLYGRPAAMWKVAYAAAARHVTLSFWRPTAGGSEQFMLAVARGRTQHLINTIKGGTPAGSGRATFRPTALGGRFEIQGKAADGTPLQVTVECARFGGIYAEGG